MPSNLKQLREILNSKIVYPETYRGDNSGRTFVKLKETGSDAKLKTVHIYDIPEDSIIIKADEIKRHKNSTTLISKETIDKNNADKRCDYIILTRVGNADWMIFMELKSGKILENEVVKQFRGAVYEMDCCESFINRFCVTDDNKFFKDFKKKFIVFCKGNINKSNTRQPNTRLKKDRPNDLDNFMRISLTNDTKNHPSINALVGC